MNYCRCSLCLKAVSFYALVLHCSEISKVGREFSKTNCRPSSFFLEWECMVELYEILFLNY